jgi:transposase
MNNYAVYVGVDVSKHSFTTTLLFNEIRKTFNVPSKPEQFENRLRPFLEELGVDKSNVLIIMESTGNYHLHLAEYLAERQYNVGLVNPFSMKRFMDAKMSRAKTDKVDSYFIAEYGRQIFKGPLFKPKTEAQKEIEARVKTLERFNKQLTMLKNQRPRRASAEGPLACARGDILHPFMLSEAKHLIFDEKRGGSSLRSERHGEGDPLPDMEGKPIA